MVKIRVRGAWAWLGRRSAVVLLVVTVLGLAVGGLARLAGADGLADRVWLVTAACGLGYALWSAADSLRRGRVVWTSLRCWRWPALWRSASCSRRR